MSTITATISPFTKSPSRQNPSTFSEDMDVRLSEENSRITQMNSMSSQMNTVAGEVNTNATTASDSATTATTQAGIATTKASEALTSANNADTSEANALSYANSALDSKNAAAASALETANKVTKVTSTDNAVVRFNGTTGEVQNSGVFIDDNGNVGIGTNSPSAKLHIKTANGYSALTTDNSSISNGFGVSPDGTAYIETSANTPLKIIVNSAERMRIDSNGNVGIGVTPSAWYSTRKVIQVGSSYFGNESVNPATEIGTNLYINTSGTPTRLDTSKPMTHYAQYNGLHQWNSGTTSLDSKMTLTSSGNLLVGTTTDNGVDKLQVNGSINANNIFKTTQNTFGALNTWYAIVGLTTNIGFLVVRNDTSGGSLFLAIDPNAGAIILADNVLGGASYTVAFSPDGSGIWKIKQTTGSLTNYSVSFNGIG